MQTSIDVARLPHPNSRMTVCGLGRGILQKVVDANSQIEFHYEGSRDLIGHKYDARSVRFWLPPPLELRAEDRNSGPPPKKLVPPTTAT